MTASQSRQPTQLPTLAGAAEPASRGRLLALGLAAAGGVAILACGLLLWRDRAELVFLDMVASALALCF